MSGLPEDLWQSVRLTIALAALTTVILLVVATPLAWWLARSKAWWAKAVAAVIALPLVLPPTVLGFYLLVTLGPNGPGGSIAGLWGGRTLAFTFEGLVIGSVIYSLPFAVQPFAAAFSAVDRRLLNASAVPPFPIEDDTDAAENTRLKSQGCFSDILVQRGQAQDRRMERYATANKTGNQ